MKEFFREWNPKPATVAMVVLCNKIITEYMADGFRLTLRQLYYQLVSRDIIANRANEYRKLGTLVTRARLAGLMDWRAIEDRVRRPHFFGHFTGVQQCVTWALQEYRLDRWEGQTCYAELWVEKDALAGVLQPLADEYHVTMMVNRGYSSASAMYESSKRFHEYLGEKDLYLFYLGDMDPSGEDMVRDIRDRMQEFGVSRMDLDVQKIALTIEQIEEYNPPENPAKFSDPRAEAYIALHGEVSWEVDALPPRVLQEIIRESFENIVDAEAMDEVKEQEETDKERLSEAAADL